MSGINMRHAFLQSFHIFNTILNFFLNTKTVIIEKN